MGDSRRVLSLSIDGAIATSDGWARHRQRMYADHFERYTIVVKTGRGEGEHVRDGPLEIIPTRSANRYTFMWDAYREGAERCRRNEVDIVTTQSPFGTGAVGLTFKKRFGVPLYVQEHGNFYANKSWRRDSLQNRVFSRLGRYVLPRADVIRVSTERERHALERFVPAGTPIIAVPISINVDEITARVDESRLSALRDRFDIGDHPVVLFVGRFVYQKNLPMWIDVASRVATTTDVAPVFVLVGGGPDRDAVERMIRESGMEEMVRLPGWADSSELATYYALADVLLLTSRWEGMPRVVVEAGMNGLPIVTTPFVGAEENIPQGRAGYIESDAQDLAKRVVWLLEHPDELTHLSRSTEAYFEEKFDPDRLIQEYVAFLNQPGDHEGRDVP